MIVSKPEVAPPYVTDKICSFRRISSPSNDIVVTSR